MAGLIYIANYFSDHDTIRKERIHGYVFHYIQQNRSRKDKTYDIQGKPARFQKIHPEVTKDKNYYITCVDFKHEEDIYDIDFYLKIIGANYDLSRIVLHKKNGSIINRTISKE